MMASNEAAGKTQPTEKPANVGQFGLYQSGLVTWQVR
jgi:hypothetical protein